MSKIQVAYQGIAGAYTDQALELFMKKNKIRLEGVPQKSFQKVFDNVVGKMGLGFIPIENSTAGSVVENYDLFLDHDVEIIGEFKMPVNHCLLVRKGVKMSQIKNVYSHPQALAQCSEFIHKNDWNAVPFFDTAGAARRVSQSIETNIAAIGSELAAKKYNLQILKRNFQNSDNNTTRFFLIKKKGTSFGFEKKLGKKDKSTLMFETKNIPAALYKCLGGFATTGVNLSKLESRPKKGGKQFMPVFYVDLEGGINDTNVKLALDEVKHFSKQVKFLGSYKRA